MPKISVILSTYNDSKYIYEAIESILNQSFRDFEMIIIDDASNDDTVRIIENFCDDRIRLYINKKNQGLTKNLNKALHLAKGEYIARMDGDDISHVERLKKQVEYLDKHLDVYLVGTAVHSFGATDLVWKLPDDSDELKIRMLLRPVFAHPSFMFRKSLVNEGYEYDESFVTAQDYDFATRVAEKYKIGRVESVLLEYRVHEKQISKVKNGNQLINADRVRKNLYDKLGVTLTEAQRDFLSKWISETKLPSTKDYKTAYGIIDTFVKGNLINHIYSTDKIEIVLKKMLYTWVIRSKSVVYILQFPYICNFSFGNMRIFFGEIVRTLKEKRQNAE